MMPDSSSPTGLGAVYLTLQAEYGVDFSQYRAAPMLRRLERRFRLSRLGRLDAYAELLRSDAQELDRLYRDLLVGVSSFFRNPGAFATLEGVALPGIVASKGEGDVVRVWVPACASGEEAYSIAMLLEELLPPERGVEVKIFATDVHRDSLEIASAGTFDRDAVAHVPPARLERHFTRSGDVYQVSPSLRRMVVFAPHDAIRDAPFARLDLVSCRNLMLYLRPVAQQRLLRTFHYALCPGGVLFLGLSESAGVVAADFEALDERAHLYRRSSVAADDEPAPASILRPLHAAVDSLADRYEELRCANAELSTRNVEHQRKIAELTQLTNDMDNLLASTDIGTLFLDRVLRIRRFTQRAAATFRLGPDALGETFDRQDLRASIESVLASGDPEEQEIDDDGRSVFVRVTPYRANGAIEGVVLTMVDVSGRRAAEAALREAVRRRDQFLAMLSHELRNPLNAIVTATSLLAALSLAPPRAASYLGILERQSHQMARLLDDLLEASRVTQDKIELRRQLLDLRTVARESADAARTTMDAHGLTFSLDLPPEPLLVDGDATRLHQVHMNLLNNAAKYTPRGGHVTLRLRREGDRAALRVVDDGVGIAPDMIGSVFDLFVQVRGTLDRAEGGLGVGLTLVRSLVSLHGGEVRCESKGVGRGTTMTVRLPLATNSGDAISSSRRLRRIELPPGALVVVVDDIADNCDLLCRLLERGGFRVHGARDGVAAVETILRLRPQVAIVDIGLPGLDGYEVARRVRATQGDEVFLVALTGYGRTIDRARAFETGFDEHLVKPVDPKRLLGMLGRAP
ncbi:MAG: response regulator [Labilithrix sp.]|nr:response regulator [Labilithrix sp.]MCW5816041.1 response regulator [Labilithrix sp.]